MPELEIVERSSGYWIVGDEPIDGPFVEYEQASDVLLAPTIRCVRICLGSDGVVTYWPLFNGSDEFEKEPISSEFGLHLVTGCGVAFELVASDPSDRSTHRYEICQDEETNVAPGETTSTITLCKV